jgi:thioesterase domain-containing protein
VRSATPDGVEFFAPLAPNINHRDTVFGGSASAIAILAAWSALYVRMRAEMRAGRIVIRRNKMSYERPIIDDFTARSAPPEAAAWAKAIATLGKGRPAEEPLLIGSVKSNLGHLEAAAGIAGLAKAVLAVSRGMIPPNRGYLTPNPHIPFDKLRLKVAAEPTEWPARKSVEPQRRIAGVSSFGFGGTNAHLILEQAPQAPQDAPAVPAVPPAAPPAPEPAVTTLVVSGKTPERLAATVAVVADRGVNVSVAGVISTLGAAVRSSAMVRPWFGTSSSVSVKAACMSAPMR